MLSLIIRTIDRRTPLSSIDISESAEGQAWLGMVGSRLTAQCRSGVGLLDCGSFSDLAPDTNQLLPLPLLLHGIDFAAYWQRFCILSMKVPQTVFALIKQLFKNIVKGVCHSSQSNC